MNMCKLKSDTPTITAGLLYCVPPNKYLTIYWFMKEKVLNDTKLIPDLIQMINGVLVWYFFWHTRNNKPALLQILFGPQFKPDGKNFVCTYLEVYCILQQRLNYSKNQANGITLPTACSEIGYGRTLHILHIRSNSHIKIIEGPALQKRRRDRK